MHKLRLLSVTLLVASCGGGAPTGRVSSSAEAEAGDVTASFEEAMTHYEAGRVAQTLRALEQSNDPRARAFHALLLNRPGRAMNVPESGPNEPELARYHALAAWRTGNGAQLVAAVERLPEGIEGFRELRAMAALAPGRRFRSTTEDSPADAAFDVSLGVPIIEVQVGAASARFIFDTGAEMTVVTPDAAEAFGVTTPVGATVQVEGNTGVSTSALGLLEQLTVLGRTISDVPVLIAPLGLPPQLQIKGIIGVQDLLGDGVLRIDYRQGVISRPGESSELGDPIVFMNGKAIVGVEGHIEGAASGLFLIDTGGRRSTLVDRYVDAALRNGASWPVSAPENVEVRAVGRAERERRFIATSQWCAASTNVCVELTDTPVDTTPADAGTVQVGKLGADAFAGQILELDYIACRVRLE